MPHPSNKAKYPLDVEYKTLFSAGTLSLYAIFETESDAHKYSFLFDNCRLVPINGTHRAFLIKQAKIPAHLMKEFL